MNSELLPILKMFLEICAMYGRIKSLRHKRMLKERPSKMLNSEQFFLQTRIPRPVFELLHTLVAGDLRKFRQRVLSRERLSLTLQFLAHGVPIQNLACTHKLGKTTVRNIILETCEVLWRLLSPNYVREPSESQYKDIAEDFKNIWNMPNCVGAIDGSYISIRRPHKLGSPQRKHKKLYSIVLMAVCDSKYTFTAVNVGSYDGQRDGDIFRLCSFGEALMTNNLPLPQSTCLSKTSSTPFPHYFVGDVTFPLRTNLMRPYAGVNLEKKKRIFNYRLTRAHRVIENAFGVLTTRWRVLRNTMEFSSENAKTVVLACVVLHNFVMHNDHARWYCPKNYVDWEGIDHVINDGTWRTDAGNNGETLRPVLSFIRRAPQYAYNLRDKLADFFVNEGAIPFQHTIDATMKDPFE